MLNIVQVPRNTYYSYQKTIMHSIFQYILIQGKAQWRKEGGTMESGKGPGD